MNEQKIQELLQALFSLRYDWKGSDNSKYNTEVIAKDGRVLVDQVIRNFLLENRDEQVGILQAKVFMYEQIISKSNFAPMIKPVRAKSKIK